MRTLIQPVLFIITLLIFGSACRTFVVKDVNYSQSVESVLLPTSKGEVYDARYAISFNILPFQYQESQDSSEVTINEVRLIRNEEGYYFITANGFSNVYVMEPIKNGLKLKKKIKVSEEGLAAPAFNMRAPFIQLVDVETSKTFNLTEKGIQTGEKQS